MSPSEGSFFDERMLKMIDKDKMIEIDLEDGEEVTEDTFKELSDGKGDKIDE